MKRLTAFMVSVCILLSASYAGGIEPASYERPVVFEDGGYVQLVENSIGIVCDSAGNAVLPEVGKSQLLMNGYVIVQEEDDTYSVYGLDGSRRTDRYNAIKTITAGIAVCGNGTWVPPGTLRGKYGAVDLESKRIVAPIQFDEVRISADGQYIIGMKTAAYVAQPNTYTVYDRSGQDVTASVGLVSWEERPPFIQVLDPCSGRFGLISKEKQTILPAKFTEIREVSESAALVRDGMKFGICSTDGSGTMLLPMHYEYDQIDLLPNGMYAAKDGGSFFHHNSGNSVTFYFSDGGRVPIYGYSALIGALGDVLFCKKPQDDTLYCLSLTGQVLGSYPGGYLAFSADTHDFVIIGRNGALEHTVLVNRWGEQIPTTPSESLLSSFSGGKGLALLDQDTGNTRFLMTDGTSIPAQESDYLDAECGLILRKGTILDVTGAELISDPTYTRISTGSYFIAGHNVAIDGYLVEDTNGRYRLLPFDFKPYEYAAHTWAIPELETAIACGLVDKSQQRNWRDVCTRGDFCRMLTVLLQDLSPTETPLVFSDTSDPAIQMASAFGIVNGIGNGVFAPSRPITRQEAAVMLARTAKLFHLNPTEKPLVFEDEIAHWAADAVSYITSVKGSTSAIMQGIGGQMFSPLGLYTREQSIITILRLYQAITNR
ncbi:MAG: S-layer homology domain-containing protein [Oscillospiraceae bacterium]|nr:S-layer homology domain-containing protein [Oscillospiraceae bacterium]